MVRNAVLALVLAAAVACSSKAKEQPPSTCGTHTPVVTASATPASLEPGGTAQLTATSTDLDDACLGAAEERIYRWRLESRPPTSTAVVSDPGSPAPTLSPDVPGEYQLEVTVTDAAGHESVPDFVTVSASACSLLAPSVSLAPASGTVSNPISLPAPVVSDGNCRASGALTFRWTLVSRPAGSSAVLSDLAAARPDLVPDVAGPYQVAVVVTNSVGVSSPAASATVSVATCGSAPPVLPALAASPALPKAGDLVTLGLTGAVDESGNALCGATAVEPFEYRWAMLARPPGSGAVLSSETSVAPSFVADVPGGTYQLALTVTDALGNVSPPAFLQVAVSACGAHPPSITSLTVTAGGAPVSRPPVGAAVSVTATVLDADATLAVCGPDVPAMSGPSYRFTLASAPAGSAVPATVGPQPDATLTFTPNVAGTYVWTVVAVDPQGLASEPVSVTIPTGPCGPTIAGTPILVSPPAGAVAGDLVTLAAGGPASTTCVQGGAAPTLTWSLAARPAGSSAVLSDPRAAAPAFTADVAGAYAVQLVVEDSGGFSTLYAANVAVGSCTSAPLILDTPSQPLATTDLITVTEPDGSGSPPSAVNAGARVTLALPSANGGRGGVQPGACGGVLSTEWSMISRPAGSQAQLSSTTAATPAFVADVPNGTWQLAVIVRDGQGNASPPYSFSVRTSGCGAFAPVFASGATLSFSSSPRANLAFTVTAPFATDGNASCPVRFWGGPPTYEFAITGQPAGTPARLTQDGSSFASISAAQGGLYAVQVVARSTTGLASAPLAATVAVSGCGAYPPVTSAFTLSQVVPDAGGGAVVVSDAPATGATLSAGGAATSARAFYVGVPLQASATVADADAGGTCAAFGIPAQGATSSWTLVQVPATSGAALGFPAGPAAAFTPDVPGSYTLALTTTDATGSASTSTVTISATCGTSAPAVASMSASQGALLSTQAAPVPLAVGAPVSLGVVALDADATASGACGVAEAQPLTYRWSFAQRPAGSQATLLGADTATPSFVPDAVSGAGRYVVALVATDPQGHAATSELAVDVTCDAAAPAVATVPGTAVPDFRATQQLAGIVVAGQGGGHAVRLVHGSAPGSWTAAVDGGPPVATTALFYPGVPLQVTANVPAVQTSAGCGAYAQTLGYAWSLRAQPAGSQATLLGASGAAPSLVPDLPGSYELELALSDQYGRTTRTVLALDAGGTPVASVGTCGRQAPTAVARVIAPAASPAGAVAHEPVGGRAVLDASGSASPDAVPFAPSGAGGCGLAPALDVAWTLVSVPPGSAASLIGPTLLDPAIDLDLPGDYVFRLAVGDGTNVGTTTLTVSAAGHLSTPAATGQVFTATTLDGAGNPVVAWWDNASGTVAAARCTGGCTGPSPTWVPLGTVDSGLAPMTFAPQDEPRPVAVAVSGASTYVAYYTSVGPGTAGAHGVRSCDLAIARHDGTGWVSWATVKTPQDLFAPFDLCTAAGAPPYIWYESGRWLSMTVSGTTPVVTYWSAVGSIATALDYAVCLTADCLAFTTGTIEGTGTGRYGRWSSVRGGDGGVLHAVYTMDDDGAGARGVRHATDASGAFVATTVESSSTVDVGRFVSLARIPANPPSGPPGPERFAVAYADRSAGIAKVARCDVTGTTCTFGSPVAIPDPSSADAGRDTVIAADPATGALRIAYLDATNGVIRVVGSPDGTTFSTAAVVSAAIPAGAPVGLSLTFGTGTALGFSQSATGPVGFFGAP